MNELRTEADDLIDALYAEWLMAQPDAAVCNGHRLVQCMEQQWGWDDFVAQLPRQLAKTLEEQWTIDLPAVPYVVLIEGRGYLQPRRKLGPVETARTFPSSTEACQAALSYLRHKGKDGWTAEAVKLDTARVRT